MEERKQSTLYIDEAGDLGINRGTRWFVLTGVVINKEDETAIRGKIHQIKSRLNLSTIHFRELRNFEQKCYVVNEIADCQFRIINVIIDTSKIDFVPKENSEPVSVIIYNYACRLLIERASWLIRDCGRVGNIILSSRGTSRDGDLINYIKTKLLTFDLNSIADVFHGVTSKTSDSWDMLQLADICATSMFYSFEINGYGFLLPCFVKRLSGHLYSYNNKIISYGIKYYANAMKPEDDYFQNNKICK